MVRMISDDGGYWIFSTPAWSAPAYEHQLHANTSVFRSGSRASAASICARIWSFVKYGISMAS